MTSLEQQASEQAVIIAEEYLNAMITGKVQAKYVGEKMKPHELTAMWARQLEKALIAEYNDMVSTVQSFLFEHNTIKDEDQLEEYFENFVEAMYNDGMYGRFIEIWGAVYGKQLRLEVSEHDSDYCPVTQHFYELVSDSLAVLYEASYTAELVMETGISPKLFKEYLLKTWDC